MYMKLKSIKKLKNIGLLNETSYTDNELLTYYNKKDNKLNLHYSKNVINNKTFILSTGEISIITFSYFLTTFYNLPQKANKIT